MIVVKIELWSARTGEQTELGRMYIANDGTSRDPKRGDYKVKVARKGSKKFNGWRDFKGWAAIKSTREGEVKDYPRLSYNVWRLITRALKSAFPEEA
jgi:hypothetical protein